MDAAAFRLPAPEPKAITVKYYYSKRNESVPVELQRRSAFGRQLLRPDSISGHAPPCNDHEYRPGAFYEINHENLPPKSPIQLKAIRIVKVSEATRLDVTVSFPSTLSLRNFFSAKLAGSGGVGFPELDERFVMSCNQAGRILRRWIPAVKVEDEKHLDSFWMVASKLVGYYPSPPAMAEMIAPAPEGGCLLALQTAGITGWGVRRRVKYIGRHRDQMLPLELKAEQEEAEVMEEEEEKVGPLVLVKGEEAEKQIGRKRARESKSKKKKRRRKEDSKSKKKPGPVKEEDKGENEERRLIIRESKDRWSAERYESAEQKLVHIMKEKGAELGRPILRQALRDEARKHIGDTGLLDHLLKHMAGKVVSDGAERLQRRHNGDGAMEYWIEPADLAEKRRLAGVADPYWVPPPGWELGDPPFPCQCGGEFRKEMVDLREEVAMLKRERNSLKQLEKQPKESECCCNWQECYKNLLTRHTHMEAKLADVSNCLHGLKEEMRMLKEENGRQVEEMMGKLEMVTSGQGREGKPVIGHGGEQENDEGKEKGEAKENANTADSCGIKIVTPDNAETNDNPSDGAAVSGGLASKRGARRSGFRICKPQGTFLWPSNGGATTPATAAGVLISTPPSASSPRAQPTAMTMEGYDQLMMIQFGGGGGGGIPTPPSASSATSSPRLLLLPPGPTSPVAPLVPPKPEQPGGPAVAPSRFSSQERRGGGSCTADNMVISGSYGHMMATRGSATSSSAVVVGDDGQEGKAAMVLTSADGPSGRSRTWRDGWEKERVEWGPGGGGSAAGSECSSSCSRSRSRSTTNLMITTDLALATPSSSYF